MQFASSVCFTPHQAEALPLGAAGAVGCSAIAGFVDGEGAPAAPTLGALALAPPVLCAAGRVAGVAAGAAAPALGVDAGADAPAALVCAAGSLGSLVSLPLHAARRPASATQVRIVILTFIARIPNPKILLEHAQNCRVCCMRYTPRGVFTHGIPLRT
jgi:hypothetical protein